MRFAIFHAVPRISSAGLLLACGGLFLLAGCKPQPVNSQPGEAPKSNKEAKARTPDPLLPEALAQAEVRTSEKWLKDGDTWFISRGAYHVELRKVTHTSYVQPISEADKLNGVEWDGGIQFKCAAGRLYDAETKQWAEWKDGGPHYIPIPVPELSLKKKGGKWEIRFAWTDYADCQKPTVELIRQLQK